MNFFAHTSSDESPWELLFTPFGEGTEQCTGESCVRCQALDRSHGHLNKVAQLAANFACEMFPPGSAKSHNAYQWGYLAGLWHDLGKFSPEWQEYLAGKVSEIHSDEVSGRKDHSTAGAVYASRFKPFGDLMAYLIAGHHAGLADGPQLFEERLKKSIPQWESEATALGVVKEAKLPPFPIDRPDGGSDDWAFLTRFFYSCLVDADFLATEAFMQPSRTSERKAWPKDILERMCASLELHLESSFCETIGVVNRARANVRESCASRAEDSPGFFSLTVPTGGGKTLSSLLFALLHARKHGMRRIIYVIPYTSIITQNADVFRTVFSELSRDLGCEVVLEHHSKFDPARETTPSRLATENWDAPLIVTTNVQFFESLYANRAGGCRKLHRIARSVIIFDEVQALPMAFLAPILKGLRCLVKDLSASLVLCTATQPAFNKRPGFAIGIPDEEITEIASDREGLFQSLKRTNSYHLGKVDDTELIENVLSRSPEGALVIVNTTKAAETLYTRFTEREVAALHLSARMCPAHVVSVLGEAKARRAEGRALYLISTQIIEAGVDISFPAVYRAECGIDSFAQAAGRCNRNGELLRENGEPAMGEVFFFEPTEHIIPKGLSDLRVAAEISRDHVIPVFDEAELLGLDAIRKYFELAVWQAGPKTKNWDIHSIVSGDIPCFPSRSSSLRAFQFKTAAERFRLIPSATHAVIIPWGEEGRKLADELKHFSKYKIPPRREQYRRAQQFTVQVYDREWSAVQNNLDFLCDGMFPVLIHPENKYHSETGLVRADEDHPHAFVL